MNPDLDLLIERQIAAPPAALWRCWTEPALLERWFCPAPWRVTDAAIDPHPGGRFDFIMRGPEGEVVPYHTCFLEVVAERRLVSTDALSHGYRPNTSAFITTFITFEPKNGGTWYTAMAKHADPHARKRHEEMGFYDGWGTVVQQLEDLARSL